MAAVQTLALPHLSHAPVHVALFQHVRNAAFLRQQLLAGNQAFEYAFLDATAVCRHPPAAFENSLHASAPPVVPVTVTCC